MLEEPTDEERVRARLTLAQSGMAHVNFDEVNRAMRELKEEKAKRWDWADWTVFIIAFIGIAAVVALVGWLIWYASERDRTFIDRCITTGMSQEQCAWIKDNTRQ